jgi:uncharacterized membrane protein (DUF106 family)
MLPSGKFIMLESCDFEHLTSIENEDQFKEMIETYILSTVTEALRLINGLAHNVPLVKTIQFQNIHDVSMPNGQEPRWVVFYLVCSLHVLDLLSHIFS